MINKKNIFTVIIILMMIELIRSRGIDGIPIPIIFLIVVIILAGAFLYVIRYKCDLKEQKYLFILTFEFSTIVMILGLLYMIKPLYPQIMHTVDIISMIILLALSISMIFTLGCLGVYKSKKDKA